MKVFILLRGFIFFALISFGIADLDSSHEEYTNLDTPAKDETDLDSGPSDVASVSKFIKEFHRKMDDEAYWTPEKAEAPQAPLDPGPQNSPVVADNQTSVVPVAGAPVSDSEDEHNATSVVNCKMERQAGSLTVELVNSTRLVTLLTSDLNITSRSQKAECAVLLFYARTCPFSCMAAPHFNALPRAFPAIKMAAVNALQYQTFNTQYGIVGVPTVMLFHNGRPAAKFNDSEHTLEMFTRFITRHSGIPPEEKMFVTSADFGGPVPSVVAKETDYWLGLAWLVIAVVGGVGVAKSPMWHNIVEAVQNSWREAEAEQHFHAD
ncbi:thioredoxin domain-containing protein 15-like [Macrosteles quadrilineatus]|uniref:thioredoxin domain-containing protein 15-like n=1 Tax=Macrosteles quadrilineatus TaxID=74068 RepID=UPI0023E098BD|nr:thioredoxin domain-containing protein 15-like [Macrosteles quadrilineatus]XP_054268104.1 thioredoxin domain-containing protein 15-like [Macrosteles quadrilineatus]